MRCSNLLYPPVLKKNKGTSQNELKFIKITSFLVLSVKISAGQTHKKTHTFTIMDYIMNPNY